MTNLLRIAFSLAVFGVFAMWTRELPSEGV